MTRYPDGVSLPPVHSGRTLANELAARELSANAFALRLRVPSNRITEIIRGERSISAETALRLGRYFGTDAAFWINLQRQYDLAMAEREFQGGYALQSKAGWRPRQPERGRWKKPLADGEIRGEGQGIRTLAVDARCWPLFQPRMITHSCRFGYTAAEALSRTSPVSGSRRSPRNGRTTRDPSARSIRTLRGPLPFQRTSTRTGSPRSR
jgi:antitoxin HigA-1